MWCTRTCILYTYLIHVVYVAPVPGVAHCGLLGPPGRPVVCLKLSWSRKYPARHSHMHQYECSSLHILLRHATISHTYYRGSANFLAFWCLSPQPLCDPVCVQKRGQATSRATAEDEVRSRGHAL